MISSDVLSLMSLTSCAGSYEALLGAMTGGRGGRGGRGRKKGGKQQRRGEPFYYLGQGTQSEHHFQSFYMCMYESFV